MALWQGQKTSKEGENQKESSARWCPNCQQIGRNVQIKLYQINLEEAMFLCTEENVSTVLKVYSKAPNRLRIRLAKKTVFS